MPLPKLILTVVIALAVATSPATAAVLTATFSGTDNGGTGSATVTWDDNNGSGELTIKIDNTSPNLLDDGTGINSSIITGIGFSTDPNLPPILSWAIFDGLGQDITAKYKIRFDDGFRGAGGGVDVETLLKTKKGIKGGFYNADAPGNTSNTFADVGVISIRFATPYLLKRIEVATLRMQRVGYLGSGSLKLLAALYAENEDPIGVPAPGAALLMLTGVGALRIMRRRRTAQ